MSPKRKKKKERRGRRKDKKEVYTNVLFVPSDNSSDLPGFNYPQTMSNYISNYSIPFEAPAGFPMCVNS